MLRLSTAAVAALLLSSISSRAQAPNDECASAITISCGQTLSGSTASAFPDEALACGVTITAPGVWYVLEGTNAQVIVTTCPNNSYDTKLNVYQGFCGVITCVGGNDDTAGVGLCSSFGFAAMEGTTYYILVQGYNGATGTFDLAVTCTPMTFDVCNGALPMTCGQTVSGTTVGATGDTAPACGTDITAPGVWYTFEGEDAQITVSTCPNSAYDTRLNVYSGACDALVCVTGNDDIVGGVLCSNVVFNGTSGTTYHVLVQGYDGQTGDFELSVSCVSCGVPQNIIISPLDVSATVTWSSDNTSSTYSIEYGPTGFTPGTGTVITGIVGVDGPPVVITGLTLATDYEILITEDCGGGDVSTTVGPVAFTTLATPPAVNALCGGALPIACGASVPGNTTNGSFTALPACGAANVTTSGVWYTFTGDGQVVSLSTCGGNAYDTKISVFSGGCSAPVCVVGGDDAPGCAANASRVDLQTTSGTEYLVLVHGYGQNQGPFSLTMTCSVACVAVENDDCPGATLLTVQPTGGCEASTGTTECVFAPAFGNPPCDPFGNIVDTWYAFNSGWTQNLTLILEAITAGTINAAIYTACDAPAYVACWNNVSAPIQLDMVPPNTDLLLRIWNGGGPVAGTYTICLEGDFSLGIPPMEEVSTTHISPVPAHDRSTVQPLAGISTLTVVDLQGRTMMITNTQGATSAQLDLAGLAPGSYVLLGDGRAIGRFIKE
ncbi:MAG: hypothetical protein IPP83_00775 [Flavobacteriales bacterium]|nr:hypothetical protein [Flavobacteriales bacterium]